MRIGQATRRLHEEQPDTGHFGRHLVHIAAQDGREVGIDHGGVATADELHHRTGAVRGADLGETHLARDALGGLLVRRIAVGVHEHDGGTAQTRVVGGPQALAQVFFVQCGDHLAMRAHALFGLDHAFVQQLGQDDVPVEKARTVLVGDAQGIAETAGCDQQRGLALALQQGVGGHRGAHLHALDQIGGDRLPGLQTEQVADAGHGCVTVLLGILGQQLVGDQGAVGALAHDVGEGAATVDPELPAGCGGIAHGVSLTGRRPSGRPGHRCRRAHAAGARAVRCRG